MRKRLSRGVLAMVVLVLLLLGGNQLIIRLFSKFSDKIITEYHEIHGLHELKVSLQKFLIVDSIYISGDRDLELIFEECDQAFTMTSESLSPVHLGEEWMAMYDLFAGLEEQLFSFFSEEHKKEDILIEIFPILNELIASVDILMYETEAEVEEYEEMNRKVRIHGTITVLIFGISLMLVMAIGGIRLVRKINRPISQLVDATRDIEDGNLKMRVEVDSKDEFLLLANSFNSMLDTIERTTVSEKHLDNILNNLYGALIVTDKEARIRFVNRITTVLLGYDEKELLRNPVISVFDKIPGQKEFSEGKDANLLKLSRVISNQTRMNSKTGTSIPVYVTCVVLKDKEGNEEGMVIVCHDVSKEKANEKKLERIRKERIIAINDAQENERLRIAGDLHDGLGQLLTGISYSVEKMHEEEEISDNQAKKLHIQVDNAIQEAKNIAHNLTPIILKDFGLVAAVKNMVEKMNQVNSTKFIFNAYDFEERIDYKLEKALFRICQEAINNIIKHAEAKSSTIQLFRDNYMIVLVVEDDGKGFELKSQDKMYLDKGIGLDSMRERVQAFDGVCTIESKIGQGTEIMIEIPCRNIINDEHNKNTDS